MSSNSSVSESTKKDTDVKSQPVIVHSAMADSMLSRLLKEKSFKVRGKKITLFSEAYV